MLPFAPFVLRSFFTLTISTFNLHALKSAVATSAGVKDICLRVPAALQCCARARSPKAQVPAGPGPTSRNRGRRLRS